MEVNILKRLKAKGGHEKTFNIQRPTLNFVESGKGSRVIRGFRIRILLGALCSFSGIGCSMLNVECSPFI
jgi:hypothetical protein